MPKPPEKLSGDALIAALARTECPVKVFRTGESIPSKVHPANAILLLKSGIFHGFGTSNRVRTLREYDPRPPAPYIPCWRNGGAACIVAWNVGSA